MMALIDFVRKQTMTERRQVHIFDVIEAPKGLKPRGGAGRGQGRKPKWNHGPTEAVRVPVEFIEQVLDLAQALDQGEEVTVTIGAIPRSSQRSPNTERAIALLTEALDLKANAGGAIKAKIREALQQLTPEV